MAQKLFDKASLVTIPSQYKEGKIYNIKPEDQSSAFEFERGSAATRVNEDGLIENSPTNGVELITNGGFDTDSDWGKNTGITISDGKSNFSGLAGQYLSQAINISSGKIYRINFTVLSGSNVLTIFLGAANNVYARSDYNIGQNTIYAVAGGNNSKIYFGSLFSGSIDNISVQEVNINTPRIDYTNGKALLLEPQRTNLVTYSDDFSQWGLGTGGISIDTGYLAPDGSNNAAKVTMDSNFNTTALTLNIGLGTTETRTIYARTVSGTGQAHLCSFNGNTDNLFTITEDWQRFEVNGAISTGAVNFYAVDFRRNTNLNEIIIWGAQAEVGSYATSYIPTNGQAETRLADVCEGGGDESTFNDSEGVFFVEVEDAKNGRIAIRNSDANRDEVVLGLTGNRFFCRIRENSNNIFTEFSDSNIDLNNSHKLAIKYKSGDSSFWFDGISQSMSDNFTLNSLNELLFTSEGNKFYGKVKSLLYFPEALTDTELQELTNNT